MMKRSAIAFVLLVSAFACGSEAVTPARPTKATVASATIELAPEGEVIELNEDQSDATDDLVHTVPTGTFADVASFCEAQMRLIAPKIAEAKAASKVDGMDDLEVEASCKESPNVLPEDANIVLAAPYTAVKAVTFETGYSTESYLLVQRQDAKDGWTAVRSSVLYWNHWDPGCGSIERPSAVVGIRVEKGALIIMTTAGRSWMKGEESGELSLTYARACRNTGVGVACGTPSVVAAKVVVPTYDNADDIRFFTTTYGVGTGVTIEPATSFDENDL